MNTGDIDLHIENWPTQSQIIKELEEHKYVYVHVRPFNGLDPCFTSGHFISGFCDIIKVPSEWLHYDYLHLQVIPKFYKEMKELLQKEVEWLNPDRYPTYQAERLMKKENVNEMSIFEIVTADTLMMILNKYDMAVQEAEQARDKWKEFCNIL